MNAKDKTEHVTKKALSLIKQLHNPPIGAVEFSGGWGGANTKAHKRHGQHWWADCI